MTASGQDSLSILQPSAPFSLKSTNAALPWEADDSPKRRIERDSRSGGVSRRYLCLSPSGGATSSSRDSPAGTLRP